MNRFAWCLLLGGWAGMFAPRSFAAEEFRVTETDDEIKIETSQLEAVIRKKGYVTGIKAASLVPSARLCLPDRRIRRPTDQGG